MSMTPLGAAWLHKRNPWMALACSIALPGLGHFYCGAYFRGFVLMTWEIIVNQFSRLNLAIFLTVMGHADKARQVVNYDWIIIYPVFYVLAMCDSYRLAVDINTRFELEQRQPVRQYQPMSISPYEISFISKRNPWMSVFLASFLGGAGHFYNFKMVKAIMLMGWHLLIWLNAGLDEAVVAMVRGDWLAAHQAIDYQWLLFFPSIHIFNIWNAYSDTVEMNKLFEEENAHFMRQVTDPSP
ncbi:MAG TPA: hypothetical protein VGK74_20730 [Symbiobacteriaceae bacterium]